MEALRRKSMSAWGMSVGVHLGIMISLALLLHMAPRTLPVEPDRPADIVLTRRDAGDEVRYFDDSGESAAAREARSIPEAALPPEDAAASLPPPDIALPARVADVGAATDSLLPGVTLNANGGRRWSLSDTDAAKVLAEEAARRRAAGVSGPVTGVSLFGGSPAQGRTFVFLIDRSKSMGSVGLGALGEAERELAKALAHLAPSHRFQVIAYHQQCVYLLNTRKLVPASDQNKQAVQDFFTGLAAFGGTEHFLALQLALGLRPDAVFLLTDGADPHLNESQLRQIRKLAAGQTTIHCIQFGFGPLQEKDNFMMRLASQNNGGYQFVSTSR